MWHGDTVSPPEHSRQYNVRFPLPLRQFSSIFRQVVRDRFRASRRVNTKINLNVQTIAAAPNRLF
jgi:hypothetical protein